MDFSLSTTQADLKATVERYCTDCFQRTSARAQDAAPPDARRHWEAFAELGWLGVLVPAELGGIGGDLLDASVILQEFGRSLVVQPYLPCAVVAVAALVRLPPGAVRDELISSIVHGKRITVLAHGESGFADDTGVIETSAQSSAAGGYVLNGRKPFVLSGNHADCFLVTAQRGEAAGPSELGVFLVKRDAPGLARRTFDTLDGRGAAELAFHDVHMESHALLGSGSSLTAALRSASEHGIVGICAEALGAMENLVHVTGAHLKSRKAYGVTLSTFQALQHRIADMLTELELSRSMFFRLLASLEQEDERLRERALSAAKALIGRSVKQSAAAGVQLHGGMGMVADYVIGKHFKQASMLDCLFGNADYHWDKCARLAA